MIDPSTDTPNKTPAPSIPPATGDENLVGPMNATFEPLTSEMTVSGESNGPNESADATVNDKAPEAPATPNVDGPPPLQPPSTSSEQRLLGCLHDVLLILISILLGAAFALILLLGLNGTLFLNEREKTSALETEINVMKTQQETSQRQQEAQGAAIATVQSQLQEFNGRLQELDQRVQNLEGGQKTLNDDLADMQSQSKELEQAIETTQQEVITLQEGQKSMEERISDMEGQIDNMSDEIIAVKETARRFDRFVKGLIALVSEVAPEELRPRDNKITPGPESKAEKTPAPPQHKEAPSTLDLFPPRQPLPTPGEDSSVVYGLVWLDVNENGVPEVGESAAPGIRILLKDSRGNVLLSMITDMAGRFAFINVPPGDYLVEAVPPEQYSPTTPDSCSLTLHPGGSMEVNFGLQ